jgi:hypothetical protein
MAPGRLFVLLAAFLVVGVPIVAFLWHAVNRLVAEPGRVVVVIPLALAFVVFLALFARTIRRLEEER